MQFTTVLELPRCVVTLEASAASETGSVRSVNEDSFVAALPLFAVADGMGGHERGDRASQLATDVLRKALVGDVPPSTTDVLEAIRAANEAVYELRADDGTPIMSGTTLAGVALVGGASDPASHWMAFNIGDSRVYSWSDGQLAQLSVDHSAVQELVDAGDLTEDDARSHPERNVITRAVGVTDDVEADVWLLPVGAQQGFVVCSDGLTKELKDDEIADILRGRPTMEGAAQALVEAANDSGGKDNITVVVVSCWVEGSAVNIENTVERLDSEATIPRLVS